MTAARAKTGNGKEAAEFRRRLFVEAYIANGCNATQAAKSAGFSEKAADRQGARLLKDATVLKMLRTRRESLARKYELTTDAVIEKLAKLIHADIRRLYRADGTLLDPKDWPDDVAAAVVGFEATEEFEGTGKDRRYVGMRKKLRMIEPTAAIQLAMRRLGLFEKDNEQSRQMTRVVIVPAKREDDKDWPALAGEGIG